MQPYSKPETKAIFDIDIYKQVNDLISSTNQLLVIASPWIRDCDHLLDGLSDLRDKGVSAIVITRPLDPNERGYSQSEQILDGLKIRGVKIKFDKRLHGKVIISDKEKIIISSANLTGKSLLSNHEIGIWSNDPNVINETYEYLEKKVIGESLSKQLVDLGKKRHAVYDLGESNDPSAIQKLIIFTRSKDANDRRLAASAFRKLAKFKPQIFSAIPSLLHLLHDSKPQVRQYAVQALGTIGASTTIPQLKKLENDEKHYVRVAVKEALEKINR
jgi:phosphatidylserine/phosphatidylglycerophosphate/cardiolipin synthase-like enzyme